MAKQAKASKASRPVHVLRHRNLKVSIWRNQTPKGPFHKITAVRSYKKGEEWRDTQAFGYDDLMNLAKLISDAHSWISTDRAKAPLVKSNVAPAQA